MPEKEADADTPPVPETPLATKPAKPPMLQAQVRQCIQPYLPPPIIKALNTLDPKLEPYVGPEGSITVAGTLLLAYVVLVLTRFLARRIVGSGRALADEYDDNVISQEQQGTFHESVLLVGPVGAGKTRLFYQLCFDDKNIPTVQSIKANVGIVGDVRYVDWPGHADLDDDLLIPIVRSRPRVVLLLDASQPVAPAADVLYQLMIQVIRNKSDKPMTVVVACHKSDMPKAKNPKRVKIQLRSELERFAQTKADVPWKSHDEVLDRVVKIRFCKSTCVGDDSDALLSYCRTGNENGFLN